MLWNDRIYDLYSSAAYEFPESAQKWMPSWLTKHPAFGKVKGDRIFKVFQNFGLNDFREKVSSHSSIEGFRDWIISNLSYVVSASSDEAKVEEPNEDAATNSIILKAKETAIRLYEMSYLLLQEVMKNAMWEGDKHKLITQVASRDKRLRIDAGTSIVKAYNIIKTVAASIDIHINDMESSNQFKNYSKRGNFYVVFSTSPEDIAAMSSRSGWSSCQKLDGEVKGLNTCVVGSSLSKFIGIIYLTTGDNFEDRGEKMVARSLVRFVVDLKTKTPAIIIDKMYPAENENFVKIMVSSLQHKTNIPVHFAEEIATDDNAGRFKIPEEKTDFAAHERSYLDNPNIFTTNFQPISNPKAFLDRSVKEIANYLSHEHWVYAMAEDAFFEKYFNMIILNATNELMINIRKDVLTLYTKQRKLSPNQLIELIKNEFARPINRAKVLKSVNNSIEHYMGSIPKEENIQATNFAKILSRYFAKLPEDIFTE